MNYSIYITPTELSDAAQSLYYKELSNDTVTLREFILGVLVIIALIFKLYIIVIALVTSLIIIGLYKLHTIQNCSYFHPMVLEWIRCPSVYVKDLLLYLGRVKPHLYLVYNIWFTSNKEIDLSPNGTVKLVNTQLRLKADKIMVNRLTKKDNLIAVIDINGIHIQDTKYIRLPDQNEGINYNE